MNELLTRDPVAFTAYYSGLTMTDFHCEMLYTIDHYPRSAIMLPAGHGKALSEDTEIPTPDGWKTMGELSVGDSVFSELGFPTTVVAKSPTWRDRECYRVGDIAADADHLWMARTEDWRGLELVRTPDLHSKRGRSARIPLAAPLAYDKCKLPIDPYILGLWLGDGHSADGRITIGDEDWDFLSAEIRRRGYEVGERNGAKAATVYGIRPVLRSIGVLNDKHIPLMYLRSPLGQRIDLLRGLVDSDGYVPASGQIEICLTNRHLADGVVELVRSLGVRCTMRTGRATLYGKDCGAKYRIGFYYQHAALLPRKAAGCRMATKYYDHYVLPEPTDRADTVCIQVANPSGMFLAGRELIPTHNSTMMKWYVVYKIAQNRNVRIILLMKNQEEVNMYARAIRQELAANQQLLKDFGRFVPSGRDAVWSNDSIIVRGRQITEPQPTVLFASAATIDSVLGKRSDIVIADDIVTPTTVSTLAQRDKQWAIFNEGVETSPQYIWDHDRNGKLLVPPHIDWPMGVGYEKLVLIGTVFDTDDLFHRKVGNIGRLPHGKLVTDCKDPAYVALKFDCWTDKEKTKPLWPARWSAEKLRLKEKSVGTIEFNKRYRNIAIDEGSMVFKRIWVYGGEDGQVKYPGCLDSRRRMGDVPEDADYLIMGLDPSTGRKGRGTSFSAFVVIAVDRKVNPIVRQIVDVYRAQLGFDDIISVITDGDDHHSLPGLHKLYDYDQGRVEANAAQTYLLDNARVKTYCLNHGLRLLPHETQTRQKNDPFVGVASMQEMVKNGWLRIPYADEPSTREKAEDFIEQLLNFPSEPYDFAMALYFAEVAVRGFGSSYRQIGNGYGKTIMNPRFQQSVA